MDVASLGDDADAYLQSMDTIATDHCFTTVPIGAYRQDEIDNLLRLCASHYRYSFQEMSNHSHICNDKEYEIYDCFG